jgi:hypothetical protein
MRPDSSDHDGRSLSGFGADRGHPLICLLLNFLHHAFGRLDFWKVHNRMN